MLEEFFFQGDAEKRLGLPQTPNMDRATTKQAELSVNFVDFIVGPFFMALTSVLPRVHECCDLMQRNRAQWTHLVEHGIRARFRASLDEAKTAEIEVGKWKKREVGFNDACTPVIEKGKRCLAGLKLTPK